MKLPFLYLAALLGLLFQGCGRQHVRQISIPLDGRTDYTSLIREILREHPQGEIRLEFNPGVYDFYPEEAEERFLRVSNNDNGTKRIAFPLDGMRRVSICGNDTEFRFHGAIVPFYIADCEEVTLRGLTFDYDLPFVLEGRVIARHPEIRGVDLKITSGNPVRVVDGENYFSSMMAGVLIAGDANSWFESGSVRDVLIRNNTFVNFGTGGENPQSVLQISPEIPTAGRGGDFRYHGRIVFTGNTVRTFDSQVIYALSVDRLEITSNRFIQSRDYPPIFDGLSYIDLQYCREADISGNRFEGDRTVEVSAVACDSVRLNPRQAGFAPAVVNKPNTFFYKQ